MAKRTAEFVRTPPEIHTPAQAVELVQVADSRLHTQERMRAAQEVRVVYQRISASFSAPVEKPPAPQELAFREKLGKEIERLEAILADGTYTAEDQKNARASLRAAGIIDEKDEIMPEYCPISGEE